jgi:hypothetical protein
MCQPEWKERLICCVHACPNAGTSNGLAVMLGKERFQPGVAVGLFDERRGSCRSGPEPRMLVQHGMHDAQHLHQHERRHQKQHDASTVSGKGLAIHDGPRV